MIIPYSSLTGHLKKQCASFYIITGQEPYLFQQAVYQIKQAWKQRHQDPEECIVHIQKPADWSDAFQEANSYSLFATHRLLDVRFDKKTLDAASQKDIQTYLNKLNPSCLVMIQSPMLSSKQLQKIVSHEQCVHIPISQLSPKALKDFIIDSLRTRHIQYEPAVPELIFQYNQNNLLACSQVLEQLSCIHDSKEPLTCATVIAYLRDQGDFSIYELGDACIEGRASDAIHMLNQMQQSQEEPTLILWLIAQEIRKIIQLQHLLKQNKPLHTACQELKIWSQKTGYYHKATQRLSLDKLYHLLGQCQALDEDLKSNRYAMPWRVLAQLVLLMCTHQ